MQVVCGISLLLRHSSLGILMLQQVTNIYWWKHRRFTPPVSHGRCQVHFASQLSYFSVGWLHNNFVSLGASSEASFFSGLTYCIKVSPYKFEAHNVLWLHKELSSVLFGSKYKLKEIRLSFQLFFKKTGTGNIYCLLSLFECTGGESYLDELPRQANLKNFVSKLSFNVTFLK